MEDTKIYDLAATTADEYQHDHSSASDGEEVYRLCPLRQPRDIRLLSVDPSEDFDVPITCTLVTKSLDDSDIRHQTISYAWESQQRKKAVACNGKTVLIRENLFSALRRIRYHESAGVRTLIPMPYLWADALCINQDDDREKSQQVEMMGSIYAGSRRLLIWLGEASEMEINELKTALHCRDSVEKRRKAILDLFARPWFLRRWVIQEVFRSPKARRHILLGTYHFLPYALGLPLKSFFGEHERGFRLTVAQRAPLFASWMAHADGKAYHPSWIHWTLEEFGHGLSLIHLLVRLSPTQCSNPLDKIYSVAGISEDGSAITPDYGARLEDVLLEIAIHQSKSSSQSVLLLCATAWCPSAQGTLPSWVPDWSTSASFASERHKWLVYGNTKTRLASDQRLPFARRLPAAVGTLEVVGRLIRGACGHAEIAGLEHCVVCGQATGSWWLLTFDYLVFELHQLDPAYGGSFKLRSFGGDLRSGPLPF